MTLTIQHQLGLLRDILDEHSGECCGSVSECQQIIRIVESMLHNDSVYDEQLLHLLPEIHAYGRQGEASENMEGHIAFHKENLDIWINAIRQTTSE